MAALVAQAAAALVARGVPVGQMEQLTLGVALAAAGLGALAGPGL